MSKIYDLGKIRAEEYERLAKRKAELEQLMHICLITVNSIVNINDLKRMEFSLMVESYLKVWKTELEYVNMKLNKK